MPVRTNGRYSRSISLSARSDELPTTIRSGRIKSATAKPSLRNSGFETTSKSTLLLAAILALTFSAVPTGTVLLSTITTYSSSIGPSSSAMPSTYDRSAEPSEPGGVGSARKIISAPWIPALRLVVKLSRCSWIFRWNRTSRPGSYIGIWPFCIRLTLSSSISTQITVFPSSAKQVPETKPT